MRTLKFLLQKEFIQLLRNKGTIKLILIMPMMQLILLPTAADFTVKNISLAVVDFDHSTYSHKLITTIESSGYFKMVGYLPSNKAGMEMVEKDRADIILEIPADFEKKLMNENSQKVFLAVNAINGTKAGIGSSYLGQIISGFGNTLNQERNPKEKYNPAPEIEITSNNWYNIFLKFPFYMVPGLLVSLLLSITTQQTAANLLKEKEAGTIEQINVTPIKKYHFIIGKLTPFFVLGGTVFTVGLVIGRVIYGIAPVGSLIALYCCAAIFSIAMLGLGLLVSTYCNTQQEAQSILFMFIMVFNMMSGLFTSADSMPEWAKFIASCFPVSHFIKVMRMIVQKGSGIADVAPDLLAIAIIAVIFNTLAILNYRKTS